MSKWELSQFCRDFILRYGHLDVPTVICVKLISLFIAMFDLAGDETSHKIIREFYEAGRIVAAVCHGPAALVNAKLSDGSYLIGNSPVTGFSNDEEDTTGLTSAMPFRLETELNKNSGGHFQKAKEAWGEHVVIAKGGRLITGQNPASAKAVGEAIYEAIFGELVSKT